MSDGIYKGHNIRPEDLPIMATEDILDMFKISVNSYWYLNSIHHAAIIRE